MVSRTRRHIPCGGPGGLVLSEHRGGGLVQDGHGDLLRVVILLPSLVVLADRLAERVSVRNFVKIRSVIITSGQNAGIGVLTCSEYCDLVLSFSLVRVGEFQGFLIGPAVLLDPEKNSPLRFFSRIMSGAYLSANLHKQVLIELLLVLVLCFAFCPLGPLRIILLGCIFGFCRLELNF